MTSRKSAHRILAVQRQLHRIEQMKLVELQQQLADLELADQQLIGALNEDEALHGLFVDAMARHLSVIRQEAARVTHSEGVQSQRMIEHGARLRFAQRMADAADIEARRLAYQRELTEIIDRLGGRGNASLP